MAFSNDSLKDVIAKMRLAKTDIQDVEVKAASEKLPVNIVETISAFSNGSGGLIILGLSEKDGFKAVKNFNPASIEDALALACSDKMIPPVRPEIDIVPFEGGMIVTAYVNEMSPFSKPCYVKDRGMYKGSYIRTGDGDRLLSSYEIDRLVEERTQPKYDLEIVEDASINNLDMQLLEAVLKRQRELHPRIFSKLSDEDAMVSLGIARADSTGLIKPTIAGLLALGVYPQQFFPRLTVTFTAFSGKNKAAENGVKFLDSESMAGPIPAVLEDTIAAVRRNMRIGGKLDGAERIDIPDYPEDAIRELVCNALMHRDYSPMGRGSQVQVNMYFDRLEVLSPGGLFGAVTVDTIGEVGASSTRNQYLAALLETTPYKGGYVAENRGSGFQLVEQELKRAGMDAPLIIDKPSLFSVTIKRNKSLEEVLGDIPLSVLSSTSIDKDAVLSFISRHSNVRTSDIVKGTGLPRSTVAYRLRKLLKDKKIEASDDSSVTNPQRTYRVVSD